MNREQYLEYVDHFNNKRYDKVTGYFAPDITVEYFDDAYAPWAPARTLHGPEEFAASYKAPILHEHTNHDPRQAKLAYPPQIDKIIDRTGMSHTSSVDIRFIIAVILQVKVAFDIRRREYAGKKNGDIRIS